MPKDEFVAEDPMELVGMVMPGGPGQLEAMAECLVEEYIRMGWDEERLMTLFKNPMFAGTFRVFRHKGEGYVRELIQNVSKKWSPVSR
jgi:pyrroline-5-carboxylate reductase